MKKSIIIFVSFFVIFLMTSNTTAVSNTLTPEKEKIIEKNEENKDYENIEKEIDILKNNLDLKHTTGLFEFLAAWLITWAIHVVDFFETFHPIAYKIMEIFEIPLLVALLFPMTYVLLVVSFFEVLFT